MGKEKKNIIKDGDLSAPVKQLSPELLKRLCGRDLSKVKYPVYMDMSDNRFQLRTLKGLEGVRRDALKELTVNNNKLFQIADLEMFRALKRLYASHNLIASVVLKNPKLVHLDLSRNRLTAIPDLSGLLSLEELYLSHNHIVGAENWKGLEDLSKTVRIVDLSHNKLNWTMDGFIENLKVLGSLKKMTSLKMQGNPCAALPDARLWIITNTPKLKILDGEEVTRKERKATPSKDHSTAMTVASTTSGGSVPPSSMGDMAPTTDMGMGMDDPYFFRVAELRKLAGRASSSPAEGCEALEQLEGIAVDMAAAPADKLKLDHGGQAPKSSSKEFAEFMCQLAERHVNLKALCMRVLVRLSLVEKDGFAEYSVNNLLTLLKGSTQNATLIWRAVREVLVPRLKGLQVDDPRSESILAILNAFSEATPAEVNRAVHELVPPLVRALNTPTPSNAVLSLLASCAGDVAVGNTLHAYGVPERVLDLFADSSSGTPRRAHLLASIARIAATSAQSAALFVERGIHTELLKAVQHAVEEGPSEGVTASTLAETMSCLLGLMKGSKDVLEMLLKEGYPGLMSKPIQAFLYAPCVVNATMRTLAALLEEQTDSSLLDDITKCLDDGAVLLRYLGEGEEWEALCAAAGVTPPLKEMSTLKNQKILDCLEAVLLVLRAYGMLASNGNKEASRICDVLDKEGRDGKLFVIMEIPEDDIRLAAMQCIAQVPLSNVDLDEMQHIVTVLTETTDPTAGAAEDILAAVLLVLTRLAGDKGKVGEAFRKEYGVVCVEHVLHMLDLNTGRDTSEDDVETRQKNGLSAASVGFLDAMSSVDEASRTLMATEKSHSLFEKVLLNEEKYPGPGTEPTGVEDTVLGDSVPAMLRTLKRLEGDGPVAARVLVRLAKTLEGPLGSPPPSNEEEQSAPLWDRPDLSGESAKDHKARVDGHTLFSESHGLAIALSAVLHIGIKEEEKEGSTSVTILPEEGVDWSEFKGRDDLFQAVLDAFAELRSRLDARDKAEAKAKEQASKERHESVAAGQKEEVLAAVQQVKSQPDASPYAPKDAQVTALEDPFALDHQEALVDDEEDELGKKVQMKDLRPLEKLPGLPHAPRAPAIAGLCRLVLAVVWDGTEATRAHAKHVLRNQVVMEAWCGVASECKWIPHNVGASLCIVLREVIELSPVVKTVPREMVPLYDSAAKVLRVLLKHISERMDYRGLTPREELVFLEAGHLCTMLGKQLTRIQFFPKNQNANFHCVKMLYHRLFPSADMDYFVKFLYYDMQMAKFPFSKDITPQEACTLGPRDSAVHSASEVIAHYMAVNKHVMYDIVEKINRAEVADGMRLRRSMFQHVVDRMTETSYGYALQRHFIKEKVFGEPNERLTFHAWLDVEGEERLVVLSTTSWMLMRPARGVPCSACTPEDFCPTGPSKLEEHPYIDVIWTCLSQCGLRLRLCYRQHGKSKEGYMTIAAKRLGVLAELQTAWMEACEADAVARKSGAGDVPGTASPAYTIPDNVSERVLRKVIAGKIKGVREAQAENAETIILASPCVKVNHRGVQQPRMVCLTDKTIYNFKMDWSKWTPLPEKEATLGGEKQEKELLKLFQYKSHRELSQLKGVQLRSDIKGKDPAGEMLELTFGVGGVGSKAAMLLKGQGGAGFYNLSFSADDLRRELWRRALIVCAPGKISWKDEAKDGMVV